MILMSTTLINSYYAGAIAFTDIVGFILLFCVYTSVFKETDYTLNLEYANPYIGLEELYRNGTAIAPDLPPILMRPDISAQVYAHKPYELASRGERDHWSTIHRTLSPREPHLYVNSTVLLLCAFWITPDATRLHHRLAPSYNFIPLTLGWRTVDLFSRCLP